MSPKFTPGPWHFNKEMSRPGKKFLYNKDGYCVAEAVGYKIDDAENAANAHLIAAAPDMLDALQYVDSYLENLGINDRMVRGEIDAAIAKARGES